MSVLTAACCRECVSPVPMAKHSASCCTKVPGASVDFEASSHFEAMTIYYRHYGWGAYTSDFAMDREPYPDDWAERQVSVSGPEEP